MYRNCQCSGNVAEATCEIRIIWGSQSNVRIPSKSASLRYDETSRITIGGWHSGADGPGMPLPYDRALKLLEWAGYLLLMG